MMLLLSYRMLLLIYKYTAAVSIYTISNRLGNSLLGVGLELILVYTFYSKQINLYLNRSLRLASISLVIGL